MKDYLALFNQHTEYQDFVQGSNFITPNVSYCIAEDEVHYNPYDRFNGHEYIDLGLPSGTLWATTNIGATTPEGYGNYYAWGETKPKTDYNWSTYKFNPSGDGLTMTKYNETDGLMTLEAEDDVAHVLWGGDWHIPTEEQCDELLNTDYVTNAWVTNYNDSGINGSLFTSVSNGNAIFIPAGGYYENNRVYNAGYNANVWASGLYSDTYSGYLYNVALNLFSSSSNVNVNGANRNYGRSVRPVIELPTGTPMGVRYTLANDSSNIRTATIGSREDDLRTLNTTMDSGFLYDVEFRFKGDISNWEIVKTVGVYMQYSTGEIIENQMVAQTLSITYNSSQDMSIISFRSNDSGQAQSGLSLQYFECVVRSPQGKLYKIRIQQEPEIA